MTSEQISVGKFGKNRTKDEVVQSVLEAMLEKPVTRTGIYYIMRQTYNDVKEIEAWLLEHDLVSLDVDKLCITKKGAEYIRALQRADKIFKGAVA